MSEFYLLALDQGTSSSRAVLFDARGVSVASAQVPLAIHYPSDGWVEQDAEAIWQSQLEAMALLEQRRPRAAQVGPCLRDHEPTGDNHALAPQHGRTLWSIPGLAGPANGVDLCGLEKRDLCRVLAASNRVGAGSLFQCQQDRLDARAHPEAGQALAADDLCFGTVDSWLLWHLTGGTRHATDISNASRTLLLDLEELSWLPEAIERVGLGPPPFRNCCRPAVPLA